MSRAAGPPSSPSAQTADTDWGTTSWRAWQVTATQLRLERTSWWMVFRVQSTEVLFSNVMVGEALLHTTLAECKEKYAQYLLCNYHSKSQCRISGIFFRATWSLLSTLLNSHCKRKGDTRFYSVNWIEYSAGIKWLEKKYQRSDIVLYYFRNLSHVCDGYDHDLYHNDSHCSELLLPRPDTDGGAALGEEVGVLSTQWIWTLQDTFLRVHFVSHNCKHCDAIRSNNDTNVVIKVSFASLLKLHT